MTIQLRPLLTAIAATCVVSALGCTDKANTPSPGDSASADTTAAASGLGHFEATPVGALQYPVRLAAGSDGTLYATDAAAERVVGYKGGRLVMALSGLDQPLGLAVHGTKLYVGNRGRGDVEVYDLAARKYLYSLGKGLGDFQMPNAIAAASDGTVYVVDSQANAVRMFDDAGHGAGTLGEAGSGDGQFIFPSSIAVDDQHVVVGDQSNHRVVMFGRDGTFLRAFGGPIPTEATSIHDYDAKFTRIQGVALAKDRVYVLDSFHGHVQALDLTGHSLAFLGRQGKCTTCMALGLDVALDKDGGVLVTDPDNRRWVNLTGATAPAPTAEEVEP